MTSILRDPLQLTFWVDETSSICSDKAILVGCGKIQVVFRFLVLLVTSMMLPKSAKYFFPYIEDEEIKYHVSYY